MIHEYDPGTLINAFLAANSCRLNICPQQAPKEWLYKASVEYPDPKFELFKVLYWFLPHACPKHPHSTHFDTPCIQLSLPITPSARHHAPLSLQSQNPPFCCWTQPIHPCRMPQVSNFGRSYPEKTEEDITLNIIIWCGTLGSTAFTSTITIIIRAYS